MTIHKCQGLSLDRALININRVFSKGQAYVALSRCRSLDGLQVVGFNPAAIEADPKCVKFYNILSGIDPALATAVGKDKTRRYERVLEKALDSFFDHHLDHVSGQEIREKQIFLETVSELYDEALARHRTRTRYSLPAKEASERLATQVMDDSTEDTSSPGLDTPGNIKFDIPPDQLLSGLLSADIDCNGNVLRGGEVAGNPERGDDHGIVPCRKRRRLAANGPVRDKVDVINLC